MKHLLLVLTCFCSLLFACEDPAPQIKQEQLVGFWKFSEGTINEMPAQDLLQGLYFEITPEQLKSELLPQLATGFSTSEPYKVDGLSMVVNEKLNISVKSVETNQLQLEFTTAQPEPKKLDLTFQREGNVRVDS